MHNSCMKNGINDSLTLDLHDIKLLAVLQRDAKVTHQAMGEQVYLSTSQVSRRVQRLEQAGLIKRYVALLDPGVANLGVRAITDVTLTRHGHEGHMFEQAIGDIDEVLDCYSVAGEADYVLQIVAPTLQDLSDKVFKRLMRIEGVANIRSNIVLARIKSTTALPLGHWA